jgi:hypothetical protein
MIASCGGCAIHLDAIVHLMQHFQRSSFKKLILPLAANFSTAYEWPVSMAKFLFASPFPLKSLYPQLFRCRCNKFVYSLYFFYKWGAYFIQK